MKNLLALSALFLFLFSSCTKSEKGTMEAKADATIPTAKVEGQITDPAGEEVTIYFQTIHHTISPDKATAKLDEEGKFSLEINVPQAGYAVFHHGRESSSMFISPGDHLLVSLNPNEFDETISYEGNGAEINNYLAEKYLVEEKLMTEAEVQNIYTLPTDEFIALSDKIYKEKIALLEQYFHDKQFAEFLKLEKTGLTAEWATERKNFKAYYAYYHDDEMSLPQDYDAYMKQVDINRTDALASSAYRNYLMNVLKSKVTDKVNASEPNLSEMEAYEKGLKMAYDVAQTEFTGKTKELLSTISLLNRMSYVGNEGIAEQMAHYTENFAASAYLPEIKTLHTKWAKLEKGQPAPDFTYVNNKGEQVSLSDFKGNVVYIDVWATWCAPCMREMPYSKKLKESFKDAEDVTFMYVSVDDTKAPWEKYLEKNPEFSGTLLWAEGWSDITKDYMISGIPRFILIDKAGNIVDVMAPRPSSGEVIEALIQETRTKDQVAI